MGTCKIVLFFSEKIIKKIFLFIMNYILKYLNFILTKKFFFNFLGGGEEMKRSCDEMGYFWVDVLLLE